MEIVVFGGRKHVSSSSYKSSGSDYELDKTGVFGVGKHVSSSGYNSSGSFYELEETHRKKKDGIVVVVIFMS